jgi:hypothetical protein
MALTNCIECGRAISTEAATCPGCGVPSPSVKPMERELLVKRSVLARSRALGGALFFGGLAWLGLAANTGRDAFVSALGPAKWVIGVGAMWYIVAELERNLLGRKTKR